jgi:hypothetical protein
MKQVPVPSSQDSLLDLIARAQADPESDEAHFLVQLRAAIAGLEGQVIPHSSRHRSPRPDLRIVRDGGIAR